MRNITKIIMASAATAALAACAPEPTEEEVAEIQGTDVAEEPATIVGVAQGNEDFSTLTTAIAAAGLGETLAGAGPFTVFAPNNAAFEKVDRETLNSLLTPEMKDDLSTLLTYHVVSGNMKAADIAKAITDSDGTATLTTVQGGTLKAMMDGENVVLEDATGNKSTVIMTDVEASNGTIHAIDTVVMPQAAE